MKLKCICQGKKPRIQFALLSKDKAHWALAAQDIGSYYEAVVKSQMVK